MLFLHFYYLSRFRKAFEYLYWPFVPLIVDPVFHEENIIVAELNFEAIDKEQMTLEVTGHYHRADLSELKIKSFQAAGCEAFTQTFHTAWSLSFQYRALRHLGWITNAQQEEARLGLYFICPQRSCMKSIHDVD